MQRTTAFINYTTRAGDTFDSLALSIYSEERLAHYIIQANPDHAGVVIFGGGVALRIPIVENVETPETLPPWRRST